MTATLVSWAPLLLVLATTRLTQLLMHDKILDVPRDWVIERSERRAGQRAIELSAQVPLGVEYRPPRAWVATLLSCVWCVSIWAALIVTGLWAVLGDASLWLFVVLALSETASILDGIVGRLFGE